MSLSRLCTALALVALAALTVQPAAAQAPTELFFSEYVEGSSLNKALEIYNGTGAAIDLGLDDYEIEVYFNGNTSAGTTIDLVGVIADGDVFVVADDGAVAAILAETDQTTTSSLWNGDDAIVLRKAGAVVDAFGQVGTDPGSQWGGGATGAQNNTLRRQAAVCAGDTDETDPFDPAGEWDGFGNDTFTGLGAHGVACAAPADPWVINEIHADPDAAAGDANGDGTVSTTQDEFVEIVNNTGASQDISGWTIADGFGVRHTFPGGTVVPDGCSVVVFAGGSPSGAFGGSVVQTSSTGQLGFNNGGDTIALNDGASDVATAGYGSEGGNDQSLTLDPDVTGPAFVLHSTATGSGGALFSPGTRIDGAAFSGCAAPAADWVINEIHADPDAAAGDANGDGTVSTTQDEFVEIVNNSGASQDISGWTLADGVGVRHTFPGGTVVPDGCSVVVFSGGSPSGTFGNSVVQTSSTGQLGFNNGGDTLTLNDGASDVATAGYGSEGGNDQSLTLDPDVTGPAFVLHSTATGSGGTLFSPGTRIDGTAFAGCTAPPAIAEIYEIQGSGLVSPFASQVVTTLGNTVTALADNGFFMQTPDARADADPETSNGVFVFTGGAPGVAVGDEVDVTGEVIEFFDFTEFSNGPTVTLVSSGNPLPAAITLDAATPSPNQPQPANELERFEGMRVEVFGGSVASGNQRFNPDPVAEAFVVAGPDRPFREPGIEFPGLPGLPVWDGNPEVFELDPDRLGLPNVTLTGGSTFDAEGVLGYEFGGYELWPTALTVDEAPLPVAVSPRMPDEMTVGALNLFRLFDDVDDPGTEDDGQVVSSAEYARRLTKFSQYVRTLMDAPDVLAVSEVESLNVLQDLADEIATDDPAIVYSAHLEEGNDVGGIDVGFLVRDTVQVNSVTQLAANEILTFDGSLLHDRPPLLLDAEYIAGSLPISVLAVHMRSLSGIDSPSSGPRVRQKRLEQAQSVAQIVQDLQDADPGIHLAVVGDFNAFEFTDGYVDVVGQVAGDFTPADNLLSGPDLVDPDLAKLTLGLVAGERYSFNFGGSAQAIDHALTTTALTSRVTNVEYPRANSDAAVDLINDAGTPLRSSDHDGLVVYVQFELDADGDGILDADDLCADTTVPESVPTHHLLPLRFALVDGDGTFDTRWFGGIVPSDVTLADTAGCSCEQILDELALPRGLDRVNRKFGCGLPVMAWWILHEVGS